MKAIRYIIYMACMALAPSCADDVHTDVGQVPEGMVEIRPSLPGMLTASPSARSMAGETNGFTPNGSLLEGKKTHPLPEGSTLWLLVEGKKENNEDFKSLKAYVVRGYGEYQSLYPCEVDKDGKVTNESVAPLFLPYGTYTFRAMSPARAFLDDDGNPVVLKDGEIPENFRMKVANGDYLISNDERYSQTCMKPKTIAETDDKVQIVELNPLINQTAQLKFTISLDPDDLFLHSCDIAPAGVEISGLQDVYGNEEGKELWNWSPALEDTLVAYPGKKDEMMVIKDDNPGVSKQEDKLVIEAAVLPTDGTSTSFIVLFNLIVNGMPTQYEMMLNQKILRAGFSYHYKGTLSIVDGIAAIEWQNVSWDTDVEIDVSVARPVMKGIGTRASFPLGPEMENPIKTLALLVFDNENMHAIGDKGYFYYEKIANETDAPDGKLTVTMPYKGKDFGQEPIKLCAVANADREKLLAAMRGKVGGGAAISFNQFKELVVDIPYCEHQDSVGLVRNVYMSGYYDGLALGQDEKIKISLGRIITRLNLSVSLSEELKKEGLDYTLSLKNVSHTAYLFPGNSSPAEPGRETDEPFYTGKLEGDNTFYYYVGPHSASSEGEATALVIEYNGKSVSVPICNDPPGVENRDYWLNRNSVYSIGIRLKKKGEVTPSARTVPGIREVEIEID